MNTRLTFLLIPLFLAIRLTECYCGEKLELSKAVFYPPAFNLPRIQFLTTLGDTVNFNTGNHFINFLPKDKISNSSILKPYGLFLKKSKLYLCDTKKSGLWILDLEHKIKRYLKLKLRMNSKLVNLVIDDKQDRAYIVDIAQNLLLLYNRQGKLLKSLKILGKPVDVAVYEDKVYILDIKERVVQIWNKDLTNFLGKIGKPGHNPGEFFMPSSIAIDDSGILYVADTGNARVQKFDQQGQFLLSIGQLGDTPGCFLRPKGIALDRKGNIYVVDAGLQNVQLFDNEGNLLLYFGKVPIKELDLKLPVKIIIDYENINLFQNLADQHFEIEYLIFISNQIGPNKVNVYGFGHPKNFSHFTTQ